MSLSDQPSEEAPTNTEGTTEGLDEQPEQPVEGQAFICDIEGCGKTFNTEMSLRMHKLRSHRVSPKTGKPSEGKPERRESAEVIASEYDNLLAILKMTKCPKPEAVCRLAEGFGFTQEGIFEAMRQNNTPLDVMRLTISLWALHCDEMIHPELARKLRITKFPVRPSYEEPYEYDRYGFRKRPSEVGELLTGVGNLLRNVRPTDETGSNLLHELTYKMGQMEERMKNPQQPVNTGESQAISLLQGQIKDLNNKLEQSEKQRIDDKFNYLEDKIEEAKKSSQQDALTAAINRGADVLEVIAKGLTVGVSANPPPEREKTTRPKGAPTIEEMVREAEPDLVE